jgi:putative tryptophan/tyrosine transport system substrate-binding protein
VNRRSFFAVLGAAAWCGTAGAQQGGRAKRIGFLGPERRLKKMEEGLRDLGYAKGWEFLVEYRPSDRSERLAGFAAELVALSVDVIVASGSQAIRAAQQATKTIPIVMTGASDPVGTGFVTSLARPGGNITGESLQSPELSGKRLELLKDIVPGLERVAVLSNPDDPPVASSIRETAQAARALNIELQFAQARRPEEFDSAFASMAAGRPGAVVILPASLMTRNAGRIAALALQRGMPAISYFREFAEEGGFLSYGPNLDELARQAATYVDKIFRGANPSDLPVEQPTKFDLVINMKTAKRLGIVVPTSILAEAGETIE